MDNSTPLPDVPLYRDASAITGYNDIEAVLRDFEFGAFTKRTRDEFLGGTLVHLDGEAHAKMRRVHANLFRRDALSFYEHHIVAPAIARSLDALRGARGDQEAAQADLIELNREMLCDMACRLIGLGDLNNHGRRTRFLELSSLLIMGIVNDSSTAPDERRVAELERAHAGKEAFWTEFVEPAVQLHRARLDAGDLPSSVEEALDLLTLLLNDDPDMTEDMILRNCIMYISGSQGAIVQAVTHTVDNLDKWFASHLDRTSERFDDAFLRRAICETLRLTPPQGILTRVAHAERTLPSGDVVPEGALVALRLGIAHQTEEIFGECPHLMDPDRRLARTDALSFGLAFGAGKHVCIGRRLALSNSTSGTEPTEGIVFKMLRAYYAAGIEPDRANPPVMGANARGHYESYPVIFTKL